MGSALNESLPVNSSDRTRVLLRLDGVIRNDDVSPDLVLLARPERPESARPPVQ